MLFASLLHFALLAFFLFMLVSLMMSVLSFAPWVPIRRRDIERVFRLAGIRQGEVFYDLGCGDGRMVFAAARRGARATGIELAAPLWCIAKFRQIFFRGGEAHIVFGDLFRADISGADVVFCFSIPSRLGEPFSSKLMREMKPGARVVSYIFKIPGLPPPHEDRPPGENPIYLYRI